MTRADVQQTYRKMQHIREMSMRAPTQREKDERESEHRRLWLTIKPFVTGARLYGEPRA